MIFDIAIIGAGPAGAVLAKQVKNKSIAVIEARRFDLPYKVGDRTKSCGGLLAPDAQKMIKKLNFTIPPEILSLFQPIEGIKTTDFDSGITKHYQRNYINIDREAFDRHLMHDVTAHKFYGINVNKIEDNGEYFTINEMIKAKTIVGADGSGSFIRRHFFKDFRPKHYVSIQEIYENKNGELGDDFECFFDSKLSDYYGWSLPKDGYKLLGFAFPPGSNCKTKFKEFKQKCGYKDALHQEGTLIIRPGFFHPVTCSERVFLIGEAGGYISPSSAEGISYAMWTAKILADSDFNQKTFRFRMKAVQLNILYKRIKSIAIYTPWLRRIIMTILGK